VQQTLLKTWGGAELSPTHRFNTDHDKNKRIRTDTTTMDSLHVFMIHRVTLNPLVTVLFQC
jgi:hypothetical protein